MSEILFADDDEALRQMVRVTLESAGHRVRLAPDGTQALAEIRRQPPDLILLDYQMGRPNGLEVCRELKADPRIAHLPVLILTGQGGLEDRLQGFEAGADDYLAKPFDVRELLARISALLRLARQGLERNPTSGLPGGEAIQEEMARRREQDEGFVICYLDLDHFKPFADHFGFAVADAVIREVGEVLSAMSEERGAFAGHIGGDDFILLAPAEEARTLAERAQRLFAERLKQYVPPEVARRGSYRGTSRDGTVLEFALSRLSAAVLRVDGLTTTLSLAELGAEVARLKRQAKQTGSSGIVEAELQGR